MGCTGSKAMETQQTAAGEYEIMLKEAQQLKAGVGLLSQHDLSGGIARNWKLNGDPKNPKDAKTAGPSNPVLMDDGSKYLGVWKDGKRNGKGKQLFKDGTVFECTWVNGQADGPCILIVGGDSLEGATQPKFVGSVKNNQANGPGEFEYSDGSVVKGYWERDEKNGFFSETWSDGTLFKGNYVDGKKDGVGMQLWPDLSSYYGEFNNDLISGWGRYQWNDGRAVRSQWKDNLMNGYGHFVWEDGRVYKGEYVEGKKEGYGCFTWPDGRASKGYWKNSQLNGLNFMTNQKGASKWTLYHNGNRERFIESAAERKDLFKKEGLSEEGPPAPSLPTWLQALASEALSEEEISSLYNTFTEASKPVATTKTIVKVEAAIEVALEEAVEDTVEAIEDVLDDIAAKEKKKADKELKKAEKEHKKEKEHKDEKKDKKDKSDKRDKKEKHKEDAE